MRVDRIDDVVRIERLAVVELDTLSQLERPDPRLRIGLPALRELAGNVSVSRHFSQVAAYLPARVEVVGIDKLRAFQAVGGRAAAHRLAQPSSMHRLGRLGLFHPDAERDRGRQSEGRGLPDEFAPTDSAFRQAALKVFQLLHGFLLLIRFNCSVEVLSYSSRTPSSILVLTSSRGPGVFYSSRGNRLKSPLHGSQVTRVPPLRVRPRSRALQASLHFESMAFDPPGKPPVDCRLRGNDAILPNSSIHPDPCLGSVGQVRAKA